MKNYSTDTAFNNSSQNESRYFGDFAGVDFSNDQVNVSERRLAYSVNMYKDYHSGQGNGIETIPGFRRSFESPTGADVFGIHSITLAGEQKVLIHSGQGLFYWKNYPKTVNCRLKMLLVALAPTGVVSGTNLFQWSLDPSIGKVISVTLQNKFDLTSNMTFDLETHTLTLGTSLLREGEVVIIEYMELAILSGDSLWNMNERASVSFVMHDLLYILDGKSYLVFDGSTVKSVSENAYIPTTYASIIPAGANQNIGVEIEQRNVLQPKFMNTFIADGVTTKFKINGQNLDEVVEVKLYGKVVESSEYTVDLKNAVVTFNVAPKKPQEVVQLLARGENGAVMFSAAHAGVCITAKKAMTELLGVTKENEKIELKSLIENCTCIAQFDNKIFFSGNEKFYNHVFFTGKNLTGHEDASYIGVLNKFQDGVGESPIKALMVVADTLVVMKASTEGTGSIFYHRGSNTDIGILPRIYPAEQGLHGTGTLGACCNFLDDPIFISKYGVEAIGQLAVRQERAIEHRSSLVDSKLLQEDLTKASIEEFNGYLWVLLNGKVFLADSRQVYGNFNAKEYEWYYLENIGVYEGQYLEYRYARAIPLELNDIKINHDGELININLANNIFLNDIETENLIGKIANVPNEEGKQNNEIFRSKCEVDIEGTKLFLNIHYVINRIKNEVTGLFDKREAVLVESPGNMTGGVFSPAVKIKMIGDNLVFGTKNGIICSFNFDKRLDGEIPSVYYSFDDRTIYSGCATKMDNCNIPHLVKSTIKKSLVIKTKVFKRSAAKVKIRTNNKPYEQIAKINSSIFSFEDVDFTDFSFATLGQSLFSLNEREKKWVEKQYFIYSDEFQKPFALYYIAFRYKVVGRIK